MIIGQITLPKQIDLAAKPGGPFAEGPTRTPGTSGADGFVTALRRRAGSDANTNAQGKDRANDLRTRAQEEPPRTEDADQRTEDLQTAEEKDRLDAEDHNQEIDPADQNPQNADRTDAIEDRDSSQSAGAGEAGASSDAQESQDEAAPAEDGKKGASTNDESPGARHLRTRAEQLDVGPDANRKSGDRTPVRTSQALDARPLGEDKGVPDGQGDPDDDRPIALIRARERARLARQKDQAGAEPGAAPGNATTSQSDESDASGRRITDRPADTGKRPNDPTPPQPAHASDALPTDRTSARDLAAKAPAARLANPAEPAARLTDAHHQGGTTRDQPDQRGNGAQSVRTSADAPPAPKGDLQGDSLFRLTLDGAADGSGKAKPAASPARTTGADRAFLTGLTRGIGAVLNQKGGSLTMRLTPASLGQVRIVMSLKGGQVSVELEAGNARAHELLRSQLPALKQTLEAKGLTVERLGVQLSAAAHQTHAGSGADTQGGATGGNGSGGRPEDAGAHHDASDGRSRGARDENPDSRHGARGGDAEESAFHRFFSGLEDERDAFEAASIRLGLDAVV